MEPAVIIGAGPCGLAAAAALSKHGYDTLILEKGTIVHSVYRYPTYMIFHSTPELLEIGGIPFTTPHEKPTRQEGLAYYRKVVEHYGLRIRTYETVEEIQKDGDGFTVLSRDRSGRWITTAARVVVVASGYFDEPNLLGITGEDLPKVSHYYQEAHPYTGMKVAVIGGNNSAIDAAMDLIRVQAEVTVICRAEQLSEKVKAWVKPVFESMVAKQKVRLLLSSVVREISEDAIIVEQEGVVQSFPNQAVLALTGFRPIRTLLESIGAEIDVPSGKPVYNQETMKTSIPGLYVAGVLTAGANANDVFIETGRFHGELIARHVAREGRD